MGSCQLSALGFMEKVFVIFINIKPFLGQIAEDSYPWMTLFILIGMSTYHVYTGKNFVAYAQGSILLSWQYWVKEYPIIMCSLQLCKKMQIYKDTVGPCVQWWETWFMEPNMSMKRLKFSQPCALKTISGLHNPPVFLSHPALQLLVAQITKARKYSVCFEDVCLAINGRSASW